MGIILSNSMAKAWQRCHKQYGYKYIQLITPRTSGLPLYRGNWLHELLEAYYNTGKWKWRHKELTKEYNKLFDEEKMMYGDLPTICGAIMVGYLRKWRAEEENWNIVGTEMQFDVPLPHGHTFRLKLDALVEDEWGLWLMEHKSHKKIPDSNYRFMDIQTARYYWAIEQVGYEPIGVLWNYIRTKVPTVPKLAYAGTKRERMSTAKIDTDAITYLKAVKDFGLDPRDYRDVILALKNNESFFVRERVPKPKEVSRRLVKDLVIIADEIEEAQDRGTDLIRTIDRSCAYMCSFTQPCLAELYGGDAKQILKANFRDATAVDYYANPEKEDSA